MKYIKALIILLLPVMATAQERWQQRVEYKMEIDMNAEANQFTGVQKLKYFNNSPDTLSRVYFHLYYNAFQPGSMMDVRSRTLPDPDRRVGDRIYKLKDDEIGYQKIQSLKQDGKKLSYTIDGTIMIVDLKKPILPNSTTEFDMSFEAQVPLQVRRTGRDNSEGIRLSMAQWYPKMAEYDRSGWHTHPYIAREFYAPWGDFDVKISIDSAYTVAATGLLQNADQIGKGYSDAKSSAKKLTYHFKAENVHDFVWAADQDYAHDIVKMRDGLEFHYFYQKDTLVETWKEMQTYIQKALPFIEKNFGAYAYPTYSVIQGGDGGMEYPMATLITGHRKLGSLVGVTVHEMMHSWYQMMLATNESYYAWMDEGFTTYASNLTEDYLFNPQYPAMNPHAANMKGYQRLVEAGKEEPMTTHSDYFSTNWAYGTAAYSKGAITLRQLEYIVGVDNLKAGLLSYYNQWRFKHPDMLDFQKVIERQSGIELDWYFDFWVNTTKTIDYGISQVYAKGAKTFVQLERVGEMPMPVDVRVTMKDGKEKWYHISLGLMRGSKPIAKDAKQLTNWPWVYPYYSFELDVPLSDIASIAIDPEEFTADMDRENNVYPMQSSSLELKGVIQE
ncbi:M1 family metallopeptidase [Reichenbachiella agarivorans]|uniref:M1 family metallopeptidase n=1 Tax=Reichenbachiella agarivorans TaxID=2979464 RepID=A0ABY6CKB1_9BACT|nr:M1 family metallopeptidase [Reichenbachiella agarivorans]UXP30927.1 M1 family metallopeptidase [Reichenbachiella agarivorans]